MIVRIYTGDDGRSNFEDLDAPTESVQRIATKVGEDLVIRKSEESSFSDWRHPSRRQFLSVIEGRMEVSPMRRGSSGQFQPDDPGGTGAGRGHDRPRPHQQIRQRLRCFRFDGSPRLGGRFYQVSRSDGWPAVDTASAAFPVDSNSPLFIMAIN